LGYRILFFEQTFPSCLHSRIFGKMYKEFSLQEFWFNWSGMEPKDQYFQTFPGVSNVQPWWKTTFTKTLTWGLSFIMLYDFAYMNWQQLGQF
jgi:hypothetical protein